VTVQLKRPVLRWHGGKWKLAPWIISAMPPHRIYVEPFGGAASVLMRKPRSYGEVYNDMWSEVVNVFRLLRDPESAARLEELLRLTPFAREEFADTEKRPFEAVQDPMERARRFIFRSFAGFGSAASNSAHTTGFRSACKRSGTTPAQDWMNYPDWLRHFTERLRGVVIENRPAIQVMQSHDGADTLHYVDPPYVQSTRGFRRRNAAYVFEMDETQHRDLAGVAHQMKGAVILSGYLCDLYEGLYGDWRRIDRETFADGARPRTESLWLNKAALGAVGMFAA
jgi:DNA adenine methylase